MAQFAIQTTVVALVALGLSSCGRQEAAAPANAPAAPAVEQPSLWSVEVMSGGKVASRVDICADSAVRAGFARPAPEIGGKPCVRVKGGDNPDGTYSALCRTDDQLYRVGSVTRGDTTADFTVEMAATRQDRKAPNYEQVRRYQRLGPCPAGWHIGDSAAPGDKEVLDTITGRRRPMPTPES